MNPNVDKTAGTFGAVGTIATITLEKFNPTLAFSVGVLTILTLIPLAVVRWRGMLYDYKVFASYQHPRSFMLFRWVFSPSLDTSRRKKSRPRIDE